MNEMITKVTDEVLRRSQRYIDEIGDFDFWDEHIKFVVHYAKQLAQKYGADVEVVELGALLHDIALVSNVGARQEHHERGAIIAAELLQQLGYDANKTEQVRQCVYRHRSSRNAQSIEEVCVADADILAHFANIPMIFQVGFVLQKKNLREVKAGLRAGLQEDFDDLSERTKRDFQPEFDAILHMLLKDV